MRAALALLLLLVSLLEAQGFVGSKMGKGKWGLPTPAISRANTARDAEYKVRVINKKKNADVTYSIPSNAFILDSFEQKGSTAIPYSCRAGSCSSCLGLLKSGSVDQSGQIFLDDDKVDMGYILTCAAYPTSDLEVEVDVEEGFYGLLREEGK